MYQTKTWPRKRSAWTQTGQRLGEDVVCFDAATLLRQLGTLLQAVDALLI
jgi:hypothetical protein